MTATRTDPLPGIHRVDKLYLELLFRCNFRCRHCYHGSDLDRPDMLTLDQAIAVLTYFAEHYECDHVCFLGGEPLLVAYLPELLAAAKHLGFHTEICTNGYKQRSRLQQCAPHLDLLRVSLDGGTPDTHDHMRRPGSFAAAFDTLASAKEHDVAFGATCTLTGDNITTIPELARRLHQLGARELMLHRLRAVGNASRDGLREVTWEQAESLHHALHEMRLDGLRINREILLPPRCPGPSGVIEKLEIAPDGRVYFSCAEVAGPGRTVRFDFSRRALTPDLDREVRS